MRRKFCECDKHTARTGHRNLHMLRLIATPVVRCYDTGVRTDPCIAHRIVKASLATESAKVPCLSGSS